MKLSGLHADGATNRPGRREYEPDSAWLSRPSYATPPDFGVYCFPPAGAGFAPFGCVENAAGNAVDCATVRLPGRGPRLGEPLVLSFEALADEITDAVAASVAKHGIPYAFLGYSLGALFAYEVAANLERLRCQRPFEIVVASMNAPERGVARSADDPGDPLEFLRKIGAPAELFDYPDLLDMTVNWLRADLAVLRSYRFTARVVSTPLLVLYGSEDDLIDRGEIIRWRDVTTAPVTVREVPGGHLFLDRYGRELIGELRRAALAGPLNRLSR